MSDTTPVIYSSLCLTLLLFVGLVGFLRGAVKDRTTDLIFCSVPQGEDRLLEQVRNYLHQRAYRVIELDPSRDVVVLSGHVKPSLALAIFLSSIAAIGLGCLGMVLGTLFPDLEKAWFWLLFLAPFVGIFYWRGADRVEQISLKLLPSGQLQVRGHKDELQSLQKTLGLEKVTL